MLVPVDQVTTQSHGKDIVHLITASSTRTLEQWREDKAAAVTIHSYMYGLGPLPTLSAWLYSFGNADHHNRVCTQGLLLGTVETGCHYG